MFKTSLTMIAALAVSGLALPALAADYTIRAVANSNEADEDFDGLSPGDFVTVEVEEAGEYDLWGRRVQG